MKNDSVSFKLVSLVIIAGVIAALIAPAEPNHSAPKPAEPPAAASGTHAD